MKLRGTVCLVAWNLKLTKSVQDLRVPSHHDRSDGPKPRRTMLLGRSSGGTFAAKQWVPIYST